MLKLIIHVSTRNKHAMKFKTSRKLNASIVEIIAVFKSLSVFHFKC